MPYSNVALAQRRLSDEVLARYRERTGKREAKLAQARAAGPLGALPAIALAERVAHMTALEARNFEAATGTYDIDQVNFLARGLKASRAVCRIMEGSESMGTAFLIAPGLIITNKHVVESMEQVGVGSCIELGFEYDGEDQACAAHQFELDPEQLFITSHDLTYDFTLIAVGASRSGVPIESFGWLPLDPRPNKIVEGEPAMVIQHPGQEDKKICLFDSELVDRIDPAESDAGPYLYYTTDTERGASGSPVFNRHWQVIALHHASVTATLHEGEKPRVVNEGIRISELIEALRSDQRLVMKSPAQREQALQRILDPRIAGSFRPQGPAVASAGVVAERRDEDAPAGRRAFEGGGRSRIVEPPLEHYRGRKGFVETFLGGTEELRVPLPTPATNIEDDVAVLLRAPSKQVLQYTHYSVVMSASRRLALFSAVNIDGAKMPASFDRKQRLFESARDTVLARDFERAADLWYWDPRMSTDYQLGPEIYDDAKTTFAFGHVTRRMDAVWGDDEDDYTLASDDTFHLTNCSPQVAAFNSGGDWGKLENAINRFVRGKGRDGTPKRLSCISGPVLAATDPEILGVQVPLAFWKVIAYADGGDLKALAFTTSQAELVDEEKRKAYESARELAGTALEAGWLTTVRAISRQTSLDFGPLVHADVLASQPGSRRRINERLLDELFGA